MMSSGIVCRTQTVLSIFGPERNTLSWTLVFQEFGQYFIEGRLDGNWNTLISILFINQHPTFQRQPPRGVPRKMYSENMQQIYRRTPMPKLQSNFIEITFRHGCSPVDLQHIFRTPFPRNTSRWLLLTFWKVLFRRKDAALDKISKFCQIFHFWPMSKLSLDFASFCSQVS